MATTLVVHPARRGLQWLRDGLWLFGRQPLALVGLPAFFMMALLLVSVVPVFGLWIGYMALPLLGQAFVQAAYLVREGVRVPLSALWAPLRDAARRTELVRMMLIYAAGQILLTWVAQWVDNGAVDQVRAVMLDDNSTEIQLQQAMSNPDLFWGMATQMSLWTIWATIFWFVPALILWQRQTVAQGVFSNLIGLWRNKVPLTLYLLAYGLLAVGLALAVQLLALLAGGVNLLVFLALILSLPMTAVFYLGLGAMYRDCFVVRAAPIPLPDTDPENTP
ncbi:BPSS1780 family membrane protein [Amphibiibacter pelophylacis]|uniref:BPSS1780 family membrane protein n=1 Tax=Amphibiibacter pelophylacis TaxID=1799477 RepID=A0ACC6P0B5_9BURK